jgi:aminomethyltransferase
MADVILRNKNVKEEVKTMRSNFTTLRYCFTDEDVFDGIRKLMSNAIKF